MSRALPPDPSRRHVLTLLGSVGGLGLLTIAGCGGGGPSGAARSSTRTGGGAGATTTTGASSTTSGAAAASCTEVPQETAGPFPGAYLGRWPHVHFEVYPKVAAATSGGTKMTTSQIAFPEGACDLMYTANG